MQNIKQKQLLIDEHINEQVLILTMK